MAEVIEKRKPITLQGKYGNQKYLCNRENSRNALLLIIAYIDKIINYKFLYQSETRLNYCEAESKNQGSGKN